jgi:hypothetical protein
VVAPWDDDGVTVLHGQDHIEPTIPLLFTVNPLQAKPARGIETEEVQLFVGQLTGWVDAIVLVRWIG